VRLKIATIVAATFLIGQLSAVGSSAPAGASLMPTRGICVSYYMSTTPVSSTWLQSQAASTTSYIKALGANEVELAIPIFVTSYNGNQVFAGTNPANSTERSPTPAETTVLVTALQEAGISVDLRPLINEDDLQPANWRGSIAPTNKATWFQSYQATIAPYLQMASTDHTAAFTVASELMSLGADPHWDRMIAWARTIYLGQLIWNPSLNGYVGGEAHPHTSLALDMYPPINLPTTATVGQLVTGWTNWYQSSLKPATPASSAIGEVGILAQNGVYPTPWYHSSTGAFDQTIQANWFRSACQFAKRSGFEGMFFYTMYFPSAPPSLTTPNPSEPSSFQPKSLQAIKNCFGA
jgi:hypothetical protein